MVPSPGCCALLCWVELWHSCVLLLGEMSFWTPQVAAVRSKHWLYHQYDSLTGETGNFPCISAPWCFSWWEIYLTLFLDVCTGYGYKKGTQNQLPSLFSSSGGGCSKCCAIVPPFLLLGREGEMERLERNYPFSSRWWIFSAISKLVHQLEWKKNVKKNRKRLQKYPGSVSFQFEEIQIIWKMFKITSGEKHVHSVKDVKFLVRSGTCMHWVTVFNYNFLGVPSREERLKAGGIRAARTNAALKCLELVGWLWVGWLWKPDCCYLALWGFSTE